MKTLATILVAVLALGALMAPAAQALSTSVVISQVYGGGGNSGATLKNDFVELHNVSCASVSVEGWSVQYSSATGQSWAGTTGTPAPVPTVLHGSIPAGGYYLVQELAGTAGTVNLPTPDATGVIGLATAAGKVALVNNGTALTGTDPHLAAGVIDFVGYGTTANGYEGTGPAPAPSNTVADLRGNNGCTETDANNTNFATGAPAPRNSANAVFLCLNCQSPTQGKTWGAIRNLYR